MKCLLQSFMFTYAKQRIQCNIGDVMRKATLRCHRHVERMDVAEYVTRLLVEGKAPVGRPRKTCRTLSLHQHVSAENSPLDIHDRMKTRAIA